MSREEAITAWLEDTALFRIQQLSFRQLQRWGHEQCGWPNVLGQEDGAAADMTSR